MRYVAVLLGVSLSALALFSAETKTFTPAQRKFWAFQPVAKPSVPAVKNKQWVKTPIDAFVLAKLEDKGVQPNARPTG